MIAPIALVACLVIYAAGVARLWRRAGRGRGGLTIADVWAFVGGWCALVLALLSPLDALADARFAPHMVQHLTLILVAAPLLALGRPALALAWVARPPFRRRWSRVAAVASASTLAAWLVHSAALWAWHEIGRASCRERV